MNRRYFVGASILSAMPSAMSAAGNIRIAFLDGVLSHALAKAKLLMTSPDVKFAGILEEDSKARSRFDQSVRGDAEANRLVGREYRKHWATPQTAN